MQTSQRQLKAKYLNQSNSSFQQFDHHQSSFGSGTNINPNATSSQSVNQSNSGMRKLLQAYYQLNPTGLQTTAKVTESSKSINFRRSNPSALPELVEFSNFDYLIFRDEDDNKQFWMFPKVNLKVNQYAYDTFQALFECAGYNNKPSNFQVIRPALVSRIPGSTSWQLLNKGEIEFL